MRKICFVVLSDEHGDCLSAFDEALRENGVDIEKIRLPYLWNFNGAYVKRLKLLLENKARDKFLIFSPHSTELFLNTPDLTITYSAYRTWFNPEKIRVIPQLRTPLRPPESVDHLTWTTKPPLRVGFMGRSFRNSRLANIVLKLPTQVRKWIVRGSYVQYADVIAFMNDLGISPMAAAAFSRIETLRTLKDAQDRYGDVQIDILERENFSGSEFELNNYVDHLERNTYIVCPRGTENYSHRIYETLARGRIPVIIDTNVVLPREIDWDDLSVLIPYESLDKIYDIIRSDYKSHSKSDFVERQRRAFSKMADLRRMRWLSDLAKDVIARVE